MKERIYGFLRFAAYAGAAGLLIYQLGRRASSGPSVGSIAENFDLPVVADTPSQSPARVSLATLRGKPVLLEVVASWCGACRRSSPTLVETFYAYRKSGVEFVAITIDDPETARRLKQDWKIPYPVAVDDGSVSKGYSVSVLPTFVLIDRDGKVQRVSTGVPSRSQLDDWLRDI